MRVDELLQLAEVVGPGQAEAALRRPARLGGRPARRGRILLRVSKFGLPLPSELPTKSLSTQPSTSAFSFLYPLGTAKFFAAQRRSVAAAPAMTVPSEQVSMTARSLLALRQVRAVWSRSSSPSCPSWS